MAPVAIPLLERIVDLSQPSLYVSIAWILFNPLFWNIVARREAKHRTLTRFFGSAWWGCAFLAVTIFTIGILRDSAFKHAMRYQPILPVLGYGEVKGVAALLFLCGSILVGSSMFVYILKYAKDLNRNRWKLGFTGTYLGDYFGILMDHKVESFPFNVVEHPMYYGSAMCFVASALWYQSPVGLLLSGLVVIVYRIAESYEGPYTTAIYQRREELRRQRAIQ